MKMRNIILSLLLSLLLSGCSIWEQFKVSTGLTPETAEVELLIKTDTLLNLRGNGSSSPVILRVYELASPILFRSLDFFSIFENDKASLGDEYIKRHEYQFEPGETFQQRLTLQPETRAIGFAVAFRDINGTSWRSVHDIEERQSYFLDVSIIKSSLTVENTVGTEQIYF